MTRPVKPALLLPFVSQNFVFFVAEIRKEDLNILRDLMEAEKVTPVIDRTYKLSEAPAAIAYLETGRARGKVVLTPD
jgi:NADPH:quinone reductase-like Zn-dependent oxidoreductase